MACAGPGGAREDRLGDRATWSPGTRVFFQPYLECPCGGWAWAPCVAGIVTRAAPVPLAPSVTPGGTGRTRPAPFVLPHHSWVAGDTSYCESTRGCPDTLLLLLCTPLLSIFTCVGPPPGEGPGTRPWVTHRHEPLGTVFPHHGDGGTWVADTQWGSGQPHSSVPGEALETTQPGVPTTAPAPQTTRTPRHPQEPLIIPISSPFDTIPTAPCFSILPFLLPVPLANPMLGDRERYLAPCSPPHRKGAQGLGALGRFGAASQTRERAARWDAGRDALGTIVLSNQCTEIETGRTLSLGTGELETQGKRRHGPKTAGVSVPWECGSNLVGELGSARYCSPPPGIAHPLPAQCPVGWVLCWQPAPNRVSAGSLGHGATWERRGVDGREMPPTEAPPAPPVTCARPRGSLTASDRTYGATATSMRLLRLTRPTPPPCAPAWTP